jgi:hypothetical protein
MPGRPSLARTPWRNLFLLCLGLLAPFSLLAALLPAPAASAAVALNAPMVGITSAPNGISTVTSRSQRALLVAWAKLG